MSTQRSAPTVRLVRLDKAGAPVGAVDVPGITAVEINPDPDEPYADGGRLDHQLVVGEDGCALALPPRPWGANLTEEQRAYVRAAMVRVGDDFRRMAQTLAPAVTRAAAELGQAVAALRAAGLDTHPARPGVRRTGRAAQVSPYGVHGPRRPR